MSFVEPTVSTPEDVLKTTTFWPSIDIPTVERSCLRVCVCLIAGTGQKNL